MSMKNIIYISNIALNGNKNINVDEILNNRDFKEEMLIYLEIPRI